MSFALIAILSISVLGIVAALFSLGGDDEPVVADGGCGACGSRAECKLADVVEKCKGKCIALMVLLALTACSTKKNTANTRWWHSFNARYNTYFNGSQAFIDGCEEKERGNADDYTEMLPLYTVGNKNSRSIGSAQFDRAIEKSEKTIRRHSIKSRPEWNKKRRKTKADVEWLSRREYNPFLWHAWLLLGKSQFQKGEFEEAAATFSYMSRLYQTQPAILARSRAWLAKSYIEMNWLYEADDVITKQRRDSIPGRARADWDYTLASYYLHAQRYDEAVASLRNAIRHEHRRKQRARMWYIMGQVETQRGNRDLAYRAYQRVIRLNPPYELEFHARIAQTEVMAAGNSKKMISKLRRMASSDNNKAYLDQVYYAIGNIYLSQRDTLHAITAYEKGNEKSTRNGIEKGVLLLTLGNIYWDREKYADAQRCYGESIGLLDQDRKDYRQLSLRSKVLDELVPHTEAIHLQDSLLALAAMPEQERNKAIDRVIAELVRKEREEKRRQQEAEAEQVAQQQGARGNTQRTTPQPSQQKSGSSTFYFYNPQAVSQGKQQFEQLWGRRENVDNWQRNNRTVVSMMNDTEEVADSIASADNPEATEAADTVAVSGGKQAADSTGLDPHKREYYLAQIPFSDEQKEACHAIIQEALYNAGVILKDKLDNLSLSERLLLRLVREYPEYENNDAAWYHLFLIYSRQYRTADAQAVLSTMQAAYPQSEWTKLLSDPYYSENQRFGKHIEDSLYAATYSAFREERYQEVEANTRLSATRFPSGAHRAKFLFVEGLSLLNIGQADSCAARMRQVVEEYPESEVSEMAGQIVRGIQQGRRLQGAHMTAADIWRQRQGSLQSGDSVQTDTLSVERDTRYVFILAYQPDSVNQNQLLYEMARYNFTAYMVRNFEISIDGDGAIGRLMVTGFLSYDEAMQYAHRLYADPQMAERLKGCRRIIVSEQNLPLLGTAYSYDEYNEFYEQQLAPVEPTERELLTRPENIVEEEEKNTDEGDDSDDDDLFGAPANQQNSNTVDFDDDFYY